MSQNTVHSLANTATTGIISVTGIYYAGPTSGTNIIARNFVHSLAVSSSSSNASLRGMGFLAGTFTAQNNMVRVGLKADGTSTASASFIRGILDNGTDAGRNFYHNSVYLGGAQTTGTTSTVAFASGGASNARTFQNNIFVNARSNSGTATSKHYAVGYSGTGVNPTGLTAGGNLFLASGTGGVFGLYNSADRSTLAAWQAATGVDAISAVGDPLFVAPTGTAATVDLHLQTSNPAEGGGIALTDSLTGAPVTVTDDFDGQTRSSLTPVDIGADAGNFTSSSGDIFPPGISYPLLTSGSIANRVLTGWASITDNSGSVSSGASAPRLYFKKSTDADVFGGNTAADNGWKYVTATGSGPYSFTMDYSLINGGSVSVGDSIQYFVVAQDAAHNFGSSPAGATASANPPVQNVNGHGAVNSFSIFGSISGTVTVGSGGTYPSLSGAGGLFAALNGAVLTGNVVVNITSDLTETGSVTLNQWLEEGAGNYTLTLQPDSATMRTISGTASAGLITLNGADRVTIDGRFGGSGRFLTFRNTDTIGPTVLFTNDSSNNIVRSCIIEGGQTSSSNAVVVFGPGTITGNNSNTLTDNQIRDRSDATGVPNTLVGTNAGTALRNTGNIIASNELFNFTSTAMRIGISGEPVNQDGADWTLTDNVIYQTAERVTNITGITFAGDGTNLIAGNIIRNLTTADMVATMGGIRIQQQYGILTVARNRIYGFSPQANNVGALEGIVFNGTTTASSIIIVNNQIAMAPGVTTDQNLFGIRDRALGGSTALIAYNSVIIGGASGSGRDTWAFHRFGPSACTLKDNIFLNVRTGGANHFAVGSATGLGSFATDYNVFSGTGTTAASFFDSSNGLNPTGTAIDFTQWKANFGGDASSSAGIPGGNFTAAMFIDAANGDLHLVPGGNPLVNALGTPIPGVTDDYDGDPRSATAPNIGADESATAPEINLQGNGATIASGATPPSISNHTDFGSVAVATGTQTRSFTVQNTGSAALNLTGTAPNLVTLSGTHAADFTVTTLPTTPVAASTDTTFVITFDPSAAGIRSATVSIASNDADEGTYTFAIQGTGLNSAPTDITLSPSSIAENNATNATVGTLSTTDADAGDTHSYSLVTGTGDTDNAAFTIDGSSLRLTASADFETKSSYSVCVQTDDGNGGTFAKAFTIAITDSNDVPAAIALTPASIAEINAPNATVGTLSATDGDMVATHTFTKVSGAGDTDNASVTIDGSSVKLIPVADFETKASYSIRVQADDGNGGVFAQALTITITDVTEGALKPLTVSVLPSSAAGIVTFSPRLSITGMATVGRTYTVTAKAKTGFFFDNWSGSKTTGTNAKTTFTFTEGDTVVANFSPTPFTSDVAGKYNSAVAGTSAEASGLFIATLSKTTGAITARLSRLGTYVAFAGKLNFRTLQFTSPAVTDGHVASLTLNLTTKRLSGTITEMIGGVAGTVHVIDASKTHDHITPPTTGVGFFNAVLGTPTTLGTLTAAQHPQGSGFALLYMGATGTVAASGLLADGTAWSSSTSLGLDQSISLYAVLRNSRSTPIFGALAGTATLDTSAVTTDVTGSGIKWFSSARSSQYYPAGYEGGLSMGLVGALRSTSTRAALGLSSAPTVVFSGGPFTSPLSVGLSGTTLLSTDKLTKLIISTSGLMTGEYKADKTAVKHGIRGIIVGKGGTAEAYGYILSPLPKVIDGTGLGGLMELNP